MVGEFDADGTGHSIIDVGEGAACISRAELHTTETSASRHDREFLARSCSANPRHELRITGPVKAHEARRDRCGAGSPADRGDLLTSTRAFYPGISRDIFLLD